jgi:hypothetical protein
VVSELGRLNIDGLDWRVHHPSDGGRGVGIVGIPASMAGNGVRAADGGPAAVPPFFATGDGLDGANANDEESYLAGARDRGATVIEVDVPSSMVDAVQDVFSRHSAANMTVS